MFLWEILHKQSQGETVEEIEETICTRRTYAFLMTAGEPLQEVTSLYQPWTPHDSLLCPPACLTHPGLS